MNAVRIDSFAYLRELLRTRAGIVLETGKEYLVQSRLLPLARKAGLTSVDELIATIASTPHGPLHTQVVEAMTTNETAFFRDSHPFDALRTHVLPQLVSARAPSRTLRIWSGACSTGQEAYSIAMLIHASFPELLRWSLEIIGTDLNTEVVERARAGVYRSHEVARGVPTEYLDRYFERDGRDFRVARAIRDMVTFRPMNLVGAWIGLPTFDVVFMRNVFIYFDVPTRRGILQRVAGVMAPDGYLFLGGAETTHNVDESFAKIQAGKAACFVRTGHAAAREPSASVRG
jgi:chemotaxis protein methyltransferase CheR